MSRAGKRQTARVLTPLPAQAELRTARLLLRPFTAADAERVQACLAVRDVAMQTLTVPHPYPAGTAAAWIAKHAAWHEAGKQVIWAIVRDDLLIGAIGLAIVATHRRAEAGYWIAREAWGQGVATEALRAVIAYGFDVLGLHRIDAQHYRENPASGAVMRKVGMRHEGLLRGVVFRDGVPRDNELYAILASDPRP